MTEMEHERSWTGGEVLFAGMTESSMLSRFKRKQQRHTPKASYILSSPHRLRGLVDVNIRFVASGPSAHHWLAVDNNGLCFVCGRNECGQLGLDDQMDRKMPTINEHLVQKNVVKGSCGKKHTVCVTSDGFSYSFGSNGMGQCGIGEIKSKPKQEELIKKPMQALVMDCQEVVCGAEFSLWLCRGKLFAAGNPQYGVLGDGSDHEYNKAENVVKLAYDPVPTPKMIKRLKDREIVKIAAGAHHCLAVDSDGIPYSWGNGEYGRLGLGTPKHEFEPTPITAFPRYVLLNKDEVLLAAGGKSSFCTSSEGLMFSWGHCKTSGESQMKPYPVYDLQGWKIRSVSCGLKTFSVAAERSVMTWGASEFGELAKGPKGKKNCANPEKCDYLEDMYTHQVVCGASFSLFLVSSKSKNLSEFPIYDPELLGSDEAEVIADKVFVREAKKAKSLSKRQLLRPRQRTSRKQGSKARVGKNLQNCEKQLNC